MHRTNRGDYRSKRSRSRSRPRGSGDGGAMARYGPAPSSRDDRRFRYDRDLGRTNSRYEDRSRERRNQNYSYSGNRSYPYDRHRRVGRSRSNRRSHRRDRQRSISRETYRHSRRMGRGGRSASTDYGSYETSSYKGGNSDKMKDLSDDSASHDDTIGSYEGVPGDVIDNRYEILRDAGLGTFGRVLLCKDLQSDSKKDIVALKVVRKVEKYSESAKIEANILKHVNEKDENGDSLCVRMHRWFEFHGHVILVFEQLGCSLYDYLKKHNYKPFPVDSIRAYAWQLLRSLKFLHQISLIHTDLKPENILLVRDTESTGDRAKACQRKGNLVPPAEDFVKLIDFGGATYDDESKSGIINTRQYRSPEVMLGVGWSFPSDIWSAACIIAELYIGELLFVTVWFPLDRLEL
ncbi:CMGC/CLK protein kinase, variant [Aphanomyces invadans]|uniref:CMGC/CLK protein kinase, variant n=1 Tax=Aphanomyces invadans TaxID=157072 RepID=A0A024UQI1_9STRA|nr:CMGC/CLK protein kinase, variant [Aphanomyces invadans]ETW08716.1 CMGC/CLK protein kinase, variant [Aphanomyces invadans]|eukprot:XP_008862521.1 CMGC/CLK protein kinase, variant [Aphanomyces invadans]